MKNEEIKARLVAETDEDEQKRFREHSHRPAGLGRDCVELRQQGARGVLGRELINWIVYVVAFAKD